MVSEVRLKFLKFAMNLTISLRSCQLNCELRNKVVNFTLNFVGKLRSSLQAKFIPFSVVVSECLHTLWLHQLGIKLVSVICTLLKWEVYCKMLKLNFLRFQQTPAKR